MEKVIELAQKLKALSEKGQGGEKKNASVFLKRLLKKHNIKMKDLEVDKLIERAIFYENKNQKKLLGQIIFSVIGPKAEIYRGNVDEFEYLYFDATELQFIEISEKYNFYWLHFLKELDIFLDAYVLRNELHSKRKTATKGTKLSKAEQETCNRMWSMYDAIEKPSLRKGLKKA